MRTPTIKGIVIALKDLLLSHEDRFLWECDGVVHVGGSFGQEIKDYQKKFVKVVWIEANPDSYKELINNIRNIKTQTAIQALVTDKDEVEYTFNISEGSGVASSIYQLHEVKDIWTDLNYREKIKIKSKRLDTILNKNRQLVGRNWGLVIDTQGSELLVLNGAPDFIKRVKYIKLEAADFEAYKGGCTLQDINKFMDANGFVEIRKKLFASKNNKNYYDLVYKNKNHIVPRIRLNILISYWKYDATNQ